jgi:hypothetical protein
MRSPVKSAFLMLLIAPALAGAQEATETTPAAAAPGNAPAPVDAQARAPAKAAPKSRNFFGQAIAELTRSVDASRAGDGQPAAHAAAPKAATAAPAPPHGKDTQVAAQEPVE